MTYLPNELVNKIIMMNAPKRYDYSSTKGSLVFDISFVASLAKYHNYTIIDRINNSDYYDNLNKWKNKNRWKLDSVIWQINTIQSVGRETMSFYEICKSLNFNQDNWTDDETDDESDDE